MVAATAPASACRQALAIGLDVSSSVDAREYVLQIEGLAAALLSPAVRAAILSTPDVPLWLSVYDWSGEHDQRLILPWAAIRNEADIAMAARVIAATERVERSPSTGVGAALVYGARLLAERRDCPQLTLDLTGDGKNNSGTGPARVTLEGAPAPLTVNALVIGLDREQSWDGGEPGLAEMTAWFQRNVVRGPGAFIETASGFQDFARAMERKLLREISVPVIGMMPGVPRG
jgi:hypothetical protein